MKEILLKVLSASLGFLFFISFLFVIKEFDLIYNGIPKLKGIFFIFIWFVFLGVILFILLENKKRANFFKKAIAPPCIFFLVICLIYNIPSEREKNCLSGAAAWFRSMELEGDLGEQGYEALESVLGRKNKCHTCVSKHKVSSCYEECVNAFKSFCMGVYIQK